MSPALAGGFLPTVPPGHVFKRQGLLMLDMLSNGVSGIRQAIETAQQGSLDFCRRVRSRQKSGKQAQTGEPPRFLSLRRRFPSLAPHRLRTTELQSFPDIA